MENQPSDPTIENLPTNEQVNDTDLYYRPQRLMRISSLANILSWVTLGFVVILTIFFISIIVMSLTTYPNVNLAELVPTLTSAIILVVPGLFLFTVLQAVSESIYILMDIEENTRKN